MSHVKVSEIKFACVYVCLWVRARVLASVAPSWKWNFNTVLCWSGFHGSESFHVRLVLLPPPSSLFVSPPLSPPSLSQPARWHSTDRRWHFDTPLCTPSSPSVVHRPERRLRCSLGDTFISFVSSALLVDASSSVFALLFCSGRDEGVRFQIFRAQHSKRGKQAEEQRPFLISLLSPSKHPLSLFQSFSCTAVTFSPSCPVGSARVSHWRAAGAEPLPSPGFNTVDQWTAPRRRPSALQTRRRRWVTAASRAPWQHNKVNWS